MKINEYQKAWADSVGLSVEENDGIVRISSKGKLLGEGASALNAILNAFEVRRKPAEVLQSQLMMFGALGKGPEDLVEAVLEVFTEEADDEDEDDVVEDA